MRVLFARVGVPYSPFTGKPIKSQPLVRWLIKFLNFKNNTIYLLAPIVRGRKENIKKKY